MRILNLPTGVGEGDTFCIRPASAFQPGEYACYTKEECEALQSVHDIVWASMVYIVDHGRLELGTEQSKLLRVALARLAAVLDRKPEIPETYPR